MKALRLLLLPAFLLLLTLAANAAEAQLPPFAPTFSYTFDDAAPDDPDVLPVSDECVVGAPCKGLWRVEIPDGQPTVGVSGVLLPSAIVSFTNGAALPEGAILGKLLISLKTSPTGNCLSEGVIAQWDMTSLNGTIDPATTTGTYSDWCSFSHWPSELSSARDAFLAASPGAVLNTRWVSCVSDLDVNTLFFAHPDGSTSHISVSHGPNVAVCGGPEVISSVSLGVSEDNPDTLQDEGGIPVRTCAAPGTFTIAVALDRNDTPPGDAIVLQDTAACSPNTPAGSDVAVPLNGGTSTLAGIDLTFSQVSSAGSTSVTTSTTGPAPPTGYKIVGLSELPLYFDIDTDAVYSGDLTVCLRYDETQVTGPEANLRLLHDSGEGYADITTSVDVEGDVVCGETAHLSTFVVAEPPAGVTPTATPSPTPRATPTHSTGVGGDILLAPAAMADESGGGDGPPVAMWLVVAGAVAGMLAMGGYARSRRRSR